MFKCCNLCLINCRQAKTVRVKKKSSVSQGWLWDSPLTSVWGNWVLDKAIFSKEWEALEGRTCLDSVSFPAIALTSTQLPMEKREKRREYRRETGKEMKESKKKQIRQRV